MNKELILRKTNTIRDLLEKPSMRKQLEIAIPRHLTVDRLLRTVVTALRMNPTLLECTQESILAAIMGCCQLGLEPEPFLGQAYLVPFKRKGVLEAVLIPGYRGYIALARRSGEVESVSAQVVYTRDHFVLQYGTQEKLEHIPVDGERGEPRGAYVVFKYKDGSYSFDYMTAEDIEKIRQRSKAKDDGPWVTDWPEMAKKTVIRRHSKLAPLAVEIQRAAAMEDRVYAGESQFDMVFPPTEDRPGLPEGKDFFVALNEYLVKKKDRAIAPDFDRLNQFLKITAEANEIEIDELKQSALHDLEGFWQQFERWESGQPAATGESGAKNGHTPPAFPFSKLKRIGLLAWEKENRDKLTEMDKEVQQAFMEKFERVMGIEYGTWLGQQQTEPGPQESESGQSKPEPQEGSQTEPVDPTEDETVTCPKTNEIMKISYCNQFCKNRKGCPVFE